MSTLADSSSTMTSESKDEDSTTSSISKQYKIARKQAEEYCETNSADQIENDIQEFDSNDYGLTFNDMTCAPAVILEGEQHAPS